MDAQGRLDRQASERDGAGGHHGPRVDARDVGPVMLADPHVLEEGGASRLTIVLIEPRLLTRECVSHSLGAARARWTVRPHASLQDWSRRDDAAEADIVLLSTADRALADDVRGGIERARGIGQGAPVILLSDREDGDKVLMALECGARGYISANMTLGVAIEAIQLVRAGGTYIPAASLLSWGRQRKDVAEAGEGVRNPFSGRQAAVLKALREGKANKTIAYELKMQESTVKVHVRNIMRKVNARNRTEVAFKTKDIFAALEPVGF